MLLFAGASALFLAGLTWSLRRLDITAADLRLAPLLLNVLVLSPLSLVMASWGLQLSARVLGRHIPSRSALAVTSVGTVAEVLPIPAGVLARSAALFRSGAGAGEIVRVLSMGGLLWFGLSAAAGSYALSRTSPASSIILCCIGIAAALASLGWFASQTQPRWTMLVLLHRSLSLILGIARVVVAFRILGSNISGVDAALLTSANIAGSYSSIVPAGLGLGEALAALAAQAVTLSAAAAFTGIALNRVIALGIAATLAASMGARGIKAPVGAHEDSR